jgi:hypothetical protein
MPRLSSEGKADRQASRAIARVTGGAALRQGASCKGGRSAPRRHDHRNEIWGSWEDRLDNLPHETSNGPPRHAAVGIARHRVRTDRPAIARSFDQGGKALWGRDDLACDADGSTIIDITTIIGMESAIGIRS